MAKNIIIGAASNYTWDQLEPWVTSIKHSGFTGDTVLCCSNMTKDTIDTLISEGVILSMYGTADENGNYSHTNSTAPHVERFIQLYNTLDQIEKSAKDVEYVVATDTRDVIFQDDPMEYLAFTLEHYTEHNLLATTEGMTYENEPWGNRNLMETFGPFFHDMLKGNEIYNVGVMGGRFKYMKAMMVNIFQMSINRPIPIVDQAVYNYLIHMEPWHSMVHFDNAEWCINLGTTVQACKEGNGDIGQLMRTDPNYMAKYQRDYKLLQPQIYENEVVDHARNVFTIVHQYDRIEEVNKIINKSYRKE